MANSNSKLAKNILATIIYYDGLNYPLTSFEAWKYMMRTDYYAPDKEPLAVSLAEVSLQLSGESLAKYIQHQNGFYFLKGRQKLVAKRIANAKISDGKLKRLRTLAWWLRLIPFVRMIGVTGRLAMKNAQAKSDWDIFVVLKHGRIWTGRTLLTIFVHLLGKRRHGKKITDRVCLNFFVTDESLEVTTKDLFSASEYMFLFPLFGCEVYERFQIRNQWIRSMKPTYALAGSCPLKTISDSKASVAIRGAGEKILGFDALEKILKKIEKKKIMQNPKTAKEGSLISADDDALVFLPNPHGPRVFDLFKEKVEHLNM